jgi:hypothetical protein
MRNSNGVFHKGIKMKIREYNGFANEVYEKDIDFNEAMKKEIKNLLVEFGEAYDLEANPEEQLENCVESIMNLMYDTKYEW